MFVPPLMWLFIILALPVLGPFRTPRLYIPGWIVGIMVGWLIVKASLSKDPIMGILAILLIGYGVSVQFALTDLIFLHSTTM